MDNTHSLPVPHASTSIEPFYADDSASVYLGDCRQVLPYLPPAELLATDPPYASAAATITTGRGKAAWGGNWGDMSLVTLMAEATLNAANLSAEHEVYWFADDLSFAALMPVFFHRYPVVQKIVWDKDTMGLGSYYRRQTEFIIYARTRGAHPFTSTNSRDIIRLRPDYASRVHPAQKPVELMTRLLTNSAANPILDPYAGSGTTALAARDLGRTVIAVEIEPRYCRTITDRLRSRSTR